MQSDSVKTTIMNAPFSYSLSDPVQGETTRKAWDAFTSFTACAAIPGMSGSYTEANARTVKTEEELEDELDRLALNNAVLDETRQSWNHVVGLESILGTHSYTVDQAVKESKPRRRQRWAKADTVAGILQYSAAGITTYASSPENLVLGAASLLTAVARGVNGAIQSYQTNTYRDDLRRAQSRTRPGRFNHFLTARTMLTEAELPKPTPPHQ